LRLLAYRLAASGLRGFDGDPVDAELDQRPENFERPFDARGVDVGDEQQLATSDDREAGSGCGV
jgi:hypothetical protein